MKNYKFKEVIDNIVSAYKEVLKDNLAGIYLHGSVAMGCATQNSDIDLLVVVKNDVKKDECRQIIDATMGVGGHPKKGIEMSIVLKKYCQNIVHPVPFILHYSDYHRHKYIADESYICGGFADRDLAAHFTTTKYRGICLYGEPIDSMFADIPKDIYLDAIFYDIADAKQDASSDSVYHILNLCRTLAYIKDDKILSKLEGGKWFLNNVENKYIGLVTKAIADYSCEGSDITFDTKVVVEFVKYIYKEINFKPSDIQ